MSDGLTTQSQIPSTIPSSTKIATESLENYGHAQVVKTLFDLSNLSAFGVLETDRQTPVLQLDFVTGINIQTGVATATNGATVDTNGGRLRLQSSTNTSGNAIFNSRRPAKYRAGQGIKAEFTPIFTSGANQSTQIWGMGNSTDGYFFGFNNNSFGILHRNAGVDTWTPQASWNGDVCNGTGDSRFTYDPTKGTPVMVKYPYLGFGNITFWMQNPANSRWLLVHTIHYANTAATTQVTNPSLFFYGQALNNGNNVNLTMYCGSVGVFLSGERAFLTPQWGIDNNKSGVTTETNILSLRNATTYNTVTNRGLIRLLDMSISSSAASGIAIFRLKINATLGGAPSYTTINGTTANNGATITSGNSIVSYDVAGTTITGGIYLRGYTVDNPNTQIIDLERYNLYVAPTETLTISGFSTNTSLLAVAINWTEDI